MKNFIAIGFILCGLSSHGAEARDLCTQAHIKAASLPIVMAAINKLGLEYKVTLPTADNVGFFDYRVIARARSGFLNGPMDKNIYKLYGSLPLKVGFGIEFGGAPVGVCMQFNSLEDLF